MAAAEELQRPLDGLGHSIAARNFYVNDASGTNDQAVGWGRDGSGNLTAFDPVTGTKTLAQLAAGGGGAAFAPRVISAAVTIPEDSVLVTHDLVIEDGATLTIEDGAVLVLV